MTHAHGGVLVVLVAFFVGALGGQIVQSTLALPIWRRASSRTLAPRESAKLAVALLALPFGMGALAVGATLAVPIVALVDPTRDHCEVFPFAPHVCFEHGTWRVHGLVEVVALAALFVVALSILGRECAALLAARRRARALLIGLARGASDGVVEDDAAFAFAVGVWRPRVIVSRGLLDALTADELAAAIAHERAHVARHHGLARVIARALGAFVIDGRVRRALTRDFVHAQEREADDDAAVHVGSRALVAAALLAVLRRTHAPASAGVPAFAGADTTARVEALCRPADEGRVTHALAYVCLLLAFVVGGAHGAIHDAAESAAGRLVDVPVHSHVHPR